MIFYTDDDDMKSCSLNSPVAEGVMYTQHTRPTGLVCSVSKVYKNFDMSYNSAPCIYCIFWRSINVNLSLIPKIM